METICYSRRVKHKAFYSIGSFSFDRFYFYATAEGFRKVRFRYVVVPPIARCLRRRLQMTGEIPVARRAAQQDFVCVLALPFNKKKKGAFALSLPVLLYVPVQGSPQADFLSRLGFSPRFLRISKSDTKFSLWSVVESRRIKKPATRRCHLPDKQLLLIRIQNTILEKISVFIRELATFFLDFCVFLWKRKEFLCVTQPARVCVSAKDRRGVDLGSLAYFFSFLRNKYISLRLGVYAKLSCVPPRFIFALCSWQAPHSRDFSTVQLLVI